ncbi:MAG: mreD [Bacillales bacterium]|jgi:rod shape-determining protein MreD|nr:mreD [Bacillales bacterium]
MIKKINLVLIGLFLFAFENIFAKNIVNVVDISKHTIVLRLVMIYLVFLAIYGKRNFAIGLSIFLGLTFDIVNLEIIGIHLVLFPSIVYLSTKLMRYLPEYMAMVSLVCFLSVMLLEIASFFSYRLIGLTQMDFLIFLEKRLLYTMLLNFVLVLICSYPFAKLSSKWGYVEY